MPLLGLTRTMVILHYKLLYSPFPDFPPIKCPTMNKVGILNNLVACRFVILSQLMSVSEQGRLASPQWKVSQKLSMAR